MEKMFLNQEKYIITKHAVERYSSRINYSEKEIKKAIHKDLYSLKNKRIITVGNKEYIFYKNSREFVIQKKAVERNSNRINYSEKEIKKAIHKDLYSLKNKRIISVGNKEYIFYKNSREFVIQKKKNGTKVLVTVIKHARHKKEKAIQNR